MLLGYRSAINCELPSFFLHSILFYFGYFLFSPLERGNLHSTFPPTTIHLLRVLLMFFLNLALPVQTIEYLHQVGLVYPKQSFFRAVFYQFGLLITGGVKLF